MDFSSELETLKKELNSGNLEKRREALTTLLVKINNLSGIYNPVEKEGFTQILMNEKIIRESWSLIILKEELMKHVKKWQGEGDLVFILLNILKTINEPSTAGEQIYGIMSSLYYDKTLYYNSALYEIFEMMEDFVLYYEELYDPLLEITEAFMVNEELRIFLPFFIRVLGKLGYRGVSYDLLERIIFTEKYKKYEEEAVDNLVKIILNQSDNILEMDKRRYGVRLIKRFDIHNKAFLKDPSEENRDILQYYMRALMDLEETRAVESIRNLLDKKVDKRLVLYALGKLKDLSSIDFIIQKIEEMIGEIEEKYTDIVPYVNALGMYNLKEPTEYLIKLFTSENKSVRLLSTNGISNLNNPELKELFIPLLNSQYEEVVKISQGFLNRIKKEAK